MYCQHCGAEISQEAHFCTSCGTKIESTSAATEMPASSTTPLDTATVPRTTGEWSSSPSDSTTNNQEFATQPAQELSQQPVMPQPSQPPYGGYSQQACRESAAQQYVETVYAHSQQTQTLTLVAFVFALVSTISICWLLIPLAWMIPMTVRTWGIYKGKKPNTVAFGVCTLLFLNLIAGILLLVADKDA